MIGPMGTDDIARKMMGDVGDKYRVQWLSARNYGKTMRQVKEIFMGFLESGASSIEVEFVDCRRSKKLSEDLDKAKAALEYCTEFDVDSNSKTEVARQALEDLK